MKKLFFVSVVFLLVISGVVSAAPTNTTGNKTSLTGNIVGAGRQAWEVTAHLSELGSGWLDKSLLSTVTAGQVIMWILLGVAVCFAALILLKIWPIILIIVVLIIIVLVIMAYAGGISFF